MKKAIRLILIIIICALVLLIGIDLWKRNQANQVYEKLEQLVIRKVNSGDGVNSHYEKDELDWYQQYGVTVDFEQLKYLNPDIVGWIRFDELDISYPILYGDSNEEYIRTNYLKESVTAGSIFMDSENSGDFMEYHPIIYGHNMRNGSMFGQLKNYKQEDFYHGNEFFTIYTDEYIYRYQIFSCHDTDAYGSVYTVGFSPDEQYMQFIRSICEASWYDTGVEVNNEDQIVTLSTCTTHTENRFVVHGKLIEVRRTKD